jgi:hypothetical protein
VTWRDIDARPEGGATAAAFGGRDLEEESDEEGAAGIADGPGAGIPGRGGAGEGGHPHVPGAGKMERFLGRVVQVETRVVSLLSALEIKA